MEQEEKEKDRRKIESYIGQLKKIEDELEDTLTNEEYRDLCDCTATVKAYLVQKKKII